VKHACGTASCREVLAFLRHSLGSPNTGTILLTDRLLSAPLSLTALTLARVCRAKLLRECDIPNGSRRFRCAGDRDKGWPCGRSPGPPRRASTPRPERASDSRQLRKRSPVNGGSYGASRIHSCGSDKGRGDPSSRQANLPRLANEKVKSVRGNPASLKS
jgi:hypothetical protein